MKPNEYSHEATDLFEERGKVYGDNYKRMGIVMSGLFPKGIYLKTTDDHNRFHLLELMVLKLTRYCENWDKGGHADSLDDNSVYSMMLREVDDEIKNGAKLPFGDKP